MSLDGGYIGSVDHAIANLHYGRRAGEATGFEHGYQEGSSDGYTKGFNEGSRRGWDDATRTANEQIREQMRYTREHIQDKAQLEAHVNAQNEQLQLLQSRVEELEAENKVLRQANPSIPDTGNQELRTLVGQLQNANQNLQTKLSNLSKEYQQQTEQYNEQIWQYNRTVVVLNSIRGVLEDLTSEDSLQAERIRNVFSKRYRSEVSKFLDREHLDASPHESQKFAQSLPNTARFLKTILEEKRPDTNIVGVGQAASPSPVPDESFEASM